MRLEFCEAPVAVTPGFLIWLEQPAGVSQDQCFTRKIMVKLGG